MSWIDKLALYPDRAIESEYARARLNGKQPQEVYFHSGGSQLHGLLFEQTGAQQMVVVHHGNAGNLAHRLHIAEAVLASGSSVLLYDYRGYGKSEGKASLAAVLEDGLAAFEYVRQQHDVPQEKIVHYGESLGCMVSAHCVTKAACAGVVLQSGFVSLFEIGRQHYPFTRILPKSMLPQAVSVDSEQIFKDRSLPLLVMHGERDAVTPVEGARRIYSAAADPKRLVLFKEATHNDLYQRYPAETREALQSFLASTLLKERSRTP